jgi:HNH endonuclease/AP2 domain
MKQINLTNTNLVALVDDEDYDFILSYNSWNLSKGYPKAAKQINKIRKTVRMHQLIIERMGIVVSDGMVCDHINRNKLDNRRCNLRLATIGQNAANADRPKNLCGYKGVSRNYDKWVARISINGKVKHLGRFDTPKQAALKYNEVAIELFGQFAQLNEINDL